MIRNTPKRASRSARASLCAAALVLASVAGSTHAAPAWITIGGQSNHALKFTRLALAWAVELGSDAAPAALVAPSAPAARTAASR